MTERLKELKKKKNRAISRAKAQEARLFRHGIALYPEDQHMRLLGEIRAERNAVLREVYAEAREIAEEQQAEIERAREFSADAILDSAERSEVASRLPFIEAEVQRMSLPALQRRIEAITANGSKVERFALWSAVTERRRELARQTSTEVFPFDPDLAELDRSLFESFHDERIAPYVSVRDAAEELASFAYSAQYDASDPATAYVNRTRSHVRELVERQRYSRGGRPLAPTGGQEPPTEPNIAS